MTIEEAHRQEMIIYINSAKDYLRMAQNVVECDDKFNDGQSKMLDEMYDSISKSLKELEKI